MKNNLIRLNSLLLKVRPAKSQAIVWLQGDRYDRGQKVFSLYAAKFAPKIILSGNNELIGPKIRVGENNISLGEMKQWLLERGVKSSAIVIDDQSFNTRDQAMFVLSLAKKNKWDRIIIVGSYPHYQARYFLTFLKAAKKLVWNGDIINQFMKIGNDKKPGGRDQTAKALMEQEFKKIKIYGAKGHMADPKIGIDYLTARI